MGHRKITSPGVNKTRQVDVAEVIDLTNPEEVKEIARSFFQDELKVDLLNPRFDKPEDFIANLRWKAERKLSYGELQQRRMSTGTHSIVIKSAPLNYRCPIDDKLVEINKHSQVHPNTKINSHFLTDCLFQTKGIKNFGRLIILMLKGKTEHFNQTEGGLQ